MSADPRFDVRGPDEFEERDYAPKPTSKSGWNSPNYPVIAAGVCPGCGAYPPCGIAGPNGHGYACQSLTALQERVNQAFRNLDAVQGS